MEKHKGKIITGVIIAAVLAFVFWWGGGSPGLRGWNTDTGDNIRINQTEIELLSKTPESDAAAESVQKKEEQAATEENKPHKAGGSSMTAVEKMESTQQATEDKSLNAPRDESYLEESPVPVESQNAVIPDRELTCTLSVRCDTILENIAFLDKEKQGLVPKDGIIYGEQTVTFYEGESVFNLLVREMKRNKIHMEFENTPINNSAYIEGIGNLYEFDCGELSGWMYKVNGWFPGYGCSSYKLKEGDKVEWVYTCDLGTDVGGNYSARNGK